MASIASALACVRGSQLRRWRWSRGILGSCQSVLQQQVRCNNTQSNVLRKLLVANRGEIACRVLTTAKRLRIPTVAVYSEADRHSRHVQMADESYCIGGAAARDSYLRADTILSVAQQAGATAVHPGYGFLSENAPFAAACEEAGIAFVGPPAEAIEAMGSKSTAKAIMSAAGVPVVPGYHGEEQSPEVLTREAQALGFPLLVKAVSGGGGKGMKLATGPDDLAAAIASAQREGAASFGDARVLLERYVTRPRHVEVQVFADQYDHAVYFFDRDCSVQRRHQKIIEEAPAPGLSDQFHASIGEAAVCAALAVGYRGAGTVEFIVDCDTGDFFFMEMNTRLQVEHPVSEAITQRDFVELQLRVAAGEALPRQEELAPLGHAFEARIYAESPLKNFLPGAGKVLRWRTPPAVHFTHEGSVRVDSGVAEGDVVGSYYDPMIAKLVVHGPDRGTALAGLVEALGQVQVAGLPTNVSFLRRLASHEAFQACELDTGFIQRHADTLLHVPPASPQLAALAAVARVKLQQREQQGAQGAAALGPWGVSDGKRLWQQLLQRCDMTYPDAGQQLRPTVTYLDNGSFAVTLPADSDSSGDGRSGHSVAHCHAPPTTVHVSHVVVCGDSLTAEVEGQRVSASLLLHSHVQERVMELWLAGEHHTFRWDQPSWSKDAKAGAATGQVVTPMPGKVVKVLVANGQSVVAGQQLLVLEAMKMEHAVVAPRAGTVAGLAVRASSQVDDGQVLLALEPQGAEPGAEERVAGVAG